MKSKNTKFNNNLKIYLLLFLSVGISLSAQLPPGYGPKPSTTAISFNGDFSNIGGTTEIAGVVKPNSPATTVGSTNPALQIKSQATFLPNGGYRTDAQTSSNYNTYSIMSGTKAAGLPFTGALLNSFPGDPANNVAAATNYLYSNGNVFPSQEYIIWEQTLNNLVAGRWYTFSMYVNNAIEPPTNTPDDPVVRLKLGGTSGLPNGTTVAGPTTLTEAATGSSQPMGGWIRVEHTFQATATTQIFKVTSAASGTWGDDFQMTQVNVVEYAPILNATSNALVCLGSTLTLTASTPATGAMTYSWTGPDGFTSSLPNPTRPNMQSSFYGDYVVTITDAAGASRTETVTVLQPPAHDTDGDGINDYCDLDDDNDGILDCIENGFGPNSSVSTIFKFNGSTSQISSNELRLTPDAGSQNGNAWSYGKVDFARSFTVSYSAYFGTKDAAGADGIATVFHNSPLGVNATGGAGMGIGAQGIANGIVLEIDTYNNGTGVGDIGNDHGQIWVANNQSGAGLLTTAKDLGNVEDGAYHNIVVNWNIDTQTLSYTLDGINAGAYTFPQNTPITSYFGGVSKVYFGYTASTGGSSNDQRVRFSNFCSDLPSELDSDNDGTPNQFDLDSDKDGCPDAIEGDENVTAAHLNPSGSIIVGANGSGGLEVNANGVPKLVNGTTHNATGGGSTAAGVADIGNDQGQGIGDSQNIMVNSCAVPFICDSNMYMVQDPQSKLYRIDTSTNPFNFVQIGTGATYPVNATGYNPTDNFIYGISGGANVAKSLIRIDANGTFYNLGVISGLDIAAGYTSGEMDELGNYYIKLAGQNNNKLYKVDVATRTATLIQLSRNINFIDIAYTQTDGLLWTQDTVSKKLVSINPTNGLVTDLPFVNTLNNYGAWFGSGTGQIYASSNDGTAFVEFNKTTGEAMFISTTQPSTNNDGAHCPTAPIKFDLYCSKLPVTNAGTQLPSNHGITALGRAGADNSNWPMVRQSAWTVLEAKTKGFVVNRVANPATDIANPVEGMMVFDTTAQCLKIYNGTVWSCYSTPACP